MPLQRNKPRRSDREVLRLALPAIVSNITTPLLGLIDTAIVGHIGSATYIGAIAIGGSMFNLVYWLMAFLRMGSSGLTAQAYGAGDIKETNQVLWRGLSIAAIASFLIMALSPLIASLMLWFMDADATTSTLARKYFLIAVTGAPAVLATYAMSGWFLGMQNSRAPMWMAIITNVSNIALSLGLVFGLGLKIAGVAAGTAIAQWIGLAAGTLMLGHRYSWRKPDWRGLIDRVAAKRFFSVNFDIFLRTLCLVAVTLWFTRAGAADGPVTLAANALLMQLFLLFSFFMDGFAFAGEALSGRYLGAGDKQGLRGAVADVFRWGIAVAALFTVIFLCFGGDILNLLTDDSIVVGSATAYLPWAVAIPAVGVAAFAWDGIYIGLTLTRQMLLAMATAMVVFFATYFILQPLMGNHGLWLAFILYLLTRGVMQTVIYSKRG